MENDVLHHLARNRAFPKWIGFMVNESERCQSSCLHDLPRKPQQHSKLIDPYYSTVKRSWLLEDEEPIIDCCKAC